MEPVIRAGETYALDRDMDEAAARAYWLGPDRQSFVAEDGALLGTYYLRANQAGGGAHVANCGYMVGQNAQGRGIARAMAQHSFATARAAGFAAIQFNFVISTNHPAVHLWQALGFAIAGRLPAAFDHPTLGRVDALVMFKPL
jgi:ribosomal protein S18 acetylase RimI-like enzyme